MVDQDQLALMMCVCGRKLFETTNFQLFGYRHNAYFRRWLGKIIQLGPTPDFENVEWGKNLARLYIFRQMFFIITFTRRYTISNCPHYIFSGISGHYDIIIG